MTHRPESGLSASVVICCYTDARWDDLGDAVRAARALDPPADEVVVVVDHNPPLGERLRALFPDLAVVDNAGERGLSGARNAGIAASRGDLLVFLDDDAVADPGLLGHLAWQAARPGVLGAGARILPAWRGARPVWFPDEFLWVVGCTYAGLRPGPVRNLIGAAMAVRRTVFGSVGGFEEALGRTRTGLPLGCEETELCIRARAADPAGRFVYEPEAVCHHRVVPDRATWRYLVRRCFAEGLSKAHLATLAGAAPAMSTERAYALRTLPRGVLRGLAAGLAGDLSGFGRAGAIGLGFAVTASGYALGRLRRAGPARPPLPGAARPLPAE